MDPQSASNPPTVSSIAAIRERLLARTFNGQSDFTTAEMTTLIEERVTRAHTPIPAARIAAIYKMIYFPQ
jgi:hypothetical protein